MGIRSGCALPSFPFPGIVKHGETLIFCRLPVWGHLIANTRRQKATDAQVFSSEGDPQMQTKNAIALILANIFGGIVQFVSVSLYLRYLGKDVYSLYIVVSGIAGYLSLVVPDISNATQKLLISRLVTSRIKEISEVICTHKQVVLIYVSVAFLLFTLASIASLFLPISHKETVSISFALIGLSTMIGLFGTTKNCILVSLQKFTTIAIINAIAALFSSTFGIITAYFTRDLSSLFVSGITYNLVYLALINIAASQNLNIRDSRPKKEIRIDILKISYRAYWHKLVNFMAGGLDRLLLAKASTNIASVSDYYLSYRLPEVLSGIVSPGILTIVPKLTAQYESFPDLAAKSLSRYLFQASIVGCIFILLPCAYGQPFLQLWLGPSAPSNSSWTVLAIGVYFYLNFYFSVASKMFQATGEMQYLAPFSGFNALATLLFTIPVARQWGIVGVGLMNMAINLVQVFPFLLVINKRYSAMLDVKKETLRCVGVLFTGCATAVPLIFIFQTPYWSSRPWLCISTSPLVAFAGLAFIVITASEFLPSGLANRLNRFIKRTKT